MFDSVFKYIGYLTISLLIGVISIISNEGTVSFIQKNAYSILTTLITLTVLHTTLTGLVLNELIKFKKENNCNADISQTLKALKRNSRIEIILIISSFLVLVSQNAITYFAKGYEVYILVVVNSLISFSLLYFIYVVLDTIEAWYQLLSNNNSTTKK